MKNIPEELIGTWRDLNLHQLPAGLDMKWINRKTIMSAHWNVLQSHIPEYCNNGSKKVIDICCGSGSMLEIMRYFGHEIKGVDINESYFPLLKSQGIPFIKHNCTELPLPFTDSESDLIICWGAFTFFPLDKWIPILDEFARISSRTIIIGINRGPELEQMRDKINNWNNPKFKLEYNQDYTWKWVKI